MTFQRRKPDNKIFKVESLPSGVIQMVKNTDSNNHTTNPNVSPIGPPYSAQYYLQVYFFKAPECFCSNVVDMEISGISIITLMII